VLGNQKILGNWDRKSPLLMGCGEDFPEWKGHVNMAELQLPVHYKYGIYNTEK
jgi:hypothetical protein